jgi:hypothetical protein
MPTLHKIACCKSDTAFFVWLYQRHIYPTDPTRANKFGEAVQEVKKEEKNEAEADRETRRRGTRRSSGTERKVREGKIGINAFVQVKIYK